MDTKSKNIASSSFTKVIVWIIFLVSLSFGVKEILSICSETVENGYKVESFFTTDYADSNAFENEAYHVFYELSSVVTGEAPEEIEVDGVDYLIMYEDQVKTNVSGSDKNYYLSQKYHVTYEYLSTEEESFSNSIEIYPNGNYWSPNEIIEPYSIYFSFHEGWVAEQQIIWEESAIYFKELNLFNALISFTLAFLAALYLMIFAGRNNERETLKLYAIDKMYAEIGFILIFALLTAIIGIFAFIIAVALESTMNESFQNPENLILIGTITVVLSVSLILALTLSYIRKVKSRTFWKTSLIGRIFVWIWKWIKIGWQRIVTNEKLNPFYKKAVVEQQKSESTKTELIANISHDLKTPLTSIISYVDLLQREEDLSDTARDYVNIIAQKSDRLNHMVSDLFDLSKSVSGNLAIEIEGLDFKKLVEQTLAEMQDKIDESDVVVKATFPKEAVMVRTDGQKMYRVLQNLIDNSLKYSLKGSRVFVSIDVVDGKAITTVKNIAGYEINFTEEEIMRRFTRGDKARSSEGSGLGLSIAESFTQSCGGEFRLVLDGDLFKVIMIFDCIE